MSCLQGVGGKMQPKEVRKKWVEKLRSGGAFVGNSLISLNDEKIADIIEEEPDGLVCS